MALFYSDKIAKKSAKSTALRTFHIQDLDYQGLGVAKADGKIWFVENALPNERVEAKVIEEKRQYGRAQAVKFEQKSAIRQTPDCIYYAKCGGCQMQHIPLELQRNTKQTALFQRLQKLQSKPIVQQPMIIGEDKGYRRRAKLSIRFEKELPIIGFRQEQSQQVVEISHCAVLEPELSLLLSPLQQLFAQWKNKKQLGHIELVQADNGTAMLLRHVGKLHPLDQNALMTFAEQQRMMLFVMSDKAQIEHWFGEQPYYQLNGLKLFFSIRDFIQINRDLNRKMVQTALDWLELRPADRVLDLFCGMGNFTLPLAQHAKSVVGIEGVEAMVEQGRYNAQINGLSNVDFYRTNLDEPFANQPWAAESFDKVLLDPARNGALFALEHLSRLAPERILYVSCNPATLVRDAEKLIQQGYQLSQCAMIDMFPHTGHLESISLFTKG